MNKKKIIILILFLLSAIGLTTSIIKLISYKMEEIKINNQLNDINNEITITEEKTNKEEIINQKETIEESNPYWDYIKINLIDVNFDELKKTNNDVKGWIKVNGTNINYPFVQTNNNKYYLNHSFDKSKNSAGWVFLDYRNEINNNEKNTILYAHGRLDKTMFGSLRNIFNSNWVNNTDNYIVKMSTEYENTLWQVFSIYKIKTTSDYLKIEFNNTEEYNSFLQMIINRSKYNFNTSISSNDRIITLSTCYNDTEKVVLHAKLIKTEKK